MTMRSYGPWDEGIDWHLDEPDELTLPIAAATVITDHLRLPAETPETNAVTRYLKAATRLAQRQTLRALRDSTYRLKLNRFPGGYIQLPWAPLQSITSFTYIDPDGTEQELAEDVEDGYQLQRPEGAIARQARLYPGRSSAWPATQSGRVDPVVIEYVAGYESDALVPEDIIEGILLVVGEMFKQRSESIVGFGVSVNPALVRARNLWMPYSLSVYK